VGIFIERIAHVNQLTQAVHIRKPPVLMLHLHRRFLYVNLVCKLINTDGSHNGTACVNGALTQAVFACTYLFTQAVLNSCRTNL